MLKGYINRLEKPKGEKPEYVFDSRLQKAAIWKTREEAEGNCETFDGNRIRITSAEGGTHICSGFKVEQLAPDKFVIFCMAPFIAREIGQADKP